MLVKLFKIIFDNLIGDLPKEDKEKAKELFLEILGIIARGAAHGAVEGLND